MNNTNKTISIKKHKKEYNNIDRKKTIECR